MGEYYFARYRLRAEGGVDAGEAARLAGFLPPLPYTHTFDLRLGPSSELNARWEAAKASPERVRTELFTIHDTGDGWVAVSTAEYERRQIVPGHHLLTCSRDYGRQTVYVPDGRVYAAPIGREIGADVSFSSFVRTACEAGMALRQGLPLHASLVEKDGAGVCFLGPSGRGKSTQAKLWRQALGADILIGDRPGLRRMPEGWQGFGMPWDGKDGIFRQRSAPIRALIWLEQAKENRIEPMSREKAMAALLRQAVMPVWDDEAMNGAAALMADLARSVPFYRLYCLPDEAAARVAWEAVAGNGG